MTQDFVLRSERDMRAVARVAYAVESDSFFGDVSDIVGGMRRRGHAQYAPMIKAAVNAVSVSDTGIALQPLSAAFASMVDAATALGKLDVVTVPLSVGAGRLLVGELDADTVEEGAPNPISRVDFAVPDRPVKAASTIVVSAEALRALGARMQAALTQLLVSAVVRAHDRIFVDALVAAGTPSGPDVGTLLTAIGSPSRPALVGGYDTLVPIAADLEGLRQLGVLVVASKAAEGLLLAVDAAGLLIGQDEDVNISIARDAMVSMTDDGAGTADVSFWQRNLAGLRAERMLSVAIRQGAVAVHGAGSP